jgi:hypothetical protein
MSRPKKEKTAFPTKVTSAIERNIIQARNNYIAHMVEPWDKPLDWIIEQLFPEYVLRACEEGYKFTTDSVKRYNSTDIDVTSDVRIAMDRQYLDRVNMLPPNNDYQGKVEEIIPELVELCNKVRGILFDYAKVSYVFNWFNTSGVSPVAIRNYCPWIRSLLPNEYLPLIEGNRFREPNKLATILDLIKETSSIMSRALLIQGTLQGRIKQGVTFRFEQTTVNGIDVPHYVMEC